MQVTTQRKCPLPITLASRDRLSHPLDANFTASHILPLPPRNQVIAKASGFALSSLDVQIWVYFHTLHEDRGCTQQIGHASREEGKCLTRDWRSVHLKVSSHRFHRQPCTNCRESDWNGSSLSVHLVPFLGPGVPDSKVTQGALDTSVSTTQLNWPHPYWLWMSPAL